MNNTENDIKYEKHWHWCLLQCCQRFCLNTLMVIKWHKSAWWKGEDWRLH